MDFISDIAFGEKSVSWILQRFLYLLDRDALFCLRKGVSSTPCWWIQGKRFDQIRYWGLSRGALFVKKNTLSQHRVESGLQISAVLSFLSTCLGNTLNYEKFQETIREVLTLREDKLLKKYMVIDIDSRFASILKNFTIVSGIKIVVIILYSYRRKVSSSPAK